MLTNPTRRWLAGLGVAGAFIAASATPAFATEAPFKFVAQNVLVAPGHGTVGFLYAQPNGAPYRFGHTSLDIDFSGITSVATLDQPGEDWGWACETSGQTVHCETEFAEGDFPWLGIQVFGNDNAKPGQDGQLKYSMTSGGHTVKTTSTVTVAEGVDLQSDPELTVSGAPGSRVGAPLTVRNGSETASHGAVLTVAGEDELYDYVGNFSNCQSAEFRFAICTFDEDLKPGKTYRLSEDLPFQLDKDARTGAKLTAFGAWWTKDDWEILNQEWPTLGKPSSAAKLRLVEADPARSLDRQTDPDAMNNFLQISMKVTGNHPADLSANGATARGKKGVVVQVRPSFTNLGPATLENQDGPVFRVTVPKGTTVVNVPDACRSYTSDEEWEDSKEGEPGAREYGCVAHVLPKGGKITYEFGLRIDKVVPNASGAVSVRLAGDPNSKNDSAAIVINPASGGQGGGDNDGGSLPITGSSTGLIAGIGALLLAAGAGGYVVARRRKTRFVA